MDGIKGSSYLTAHHAEVRWCHCSHTLERPALERHKIVTVTSSRFSEDKNRRETLLFDLYCILPIDKLLDNAIPSSFVTSPLDVHGLKGVGDGTG